jgi:hypothetical protein
VILHEAVGRKTSGLILISVGISMVFVPELGLNIHLLGPVKTLIKEENVRFTGGFKYADNGTVFVPNPGPIKYTGVPNPQGRQKLG